jgi:hypothetical protein
MNIGFVSRGPLAGQGWCRRRQPGERVRHRGKTLGRLAGGGGAVEEAHKGATALLVAHGLGLAAVMQGG